MYKIQRFSLYLRIFFQIAFVIWPIWLILYWVSAPHRFDFLSIISFIPWQLEILHPLTNADIIWGFCISLLPTAIVMTILYFLIKLFRLYERGKIFTLLNVKYLKNIGITMLIGQVVGFFYYCLISFALTWHNPPGHKVASFTFSNYDIYNIVTAIMIIVIAWVMAEGCKLQEEQRYTV
jgi:hypothetical protein